MKKSITIFSFIVMMCSKSVFAQNDPEPWKADQLITPEDLATIMNNPTTPQPLIINIGPAGLIKDAVNIGPTHEKENLDKLREFLSKEKKDRQIIIYCGCCPFEHCPNIRPAFQLLNEMNFTNQKLLSLPHNLKADWINKGYPMTTIQ